MNLFNKLLYTLALLFIIISCSSEQEPKEVQHYTSGLKNPTDTLAVPPDLTGLKTKNKYTLPKGAIRASEINNKNDKDIKVLPMYKNMHIENQGSQKWLIIENANTKKIWNDLKSFWLEMGFAIEKEEPQIGFMETKWAENRTKIPNDPIRKLFEKIGLGMVYSSSFMDKFVIRLENNHNQYSQVTFSHQGKEEVLTGRNKETSQWQSRPKDSNLEAQYLARFMLFLGADKESVDSNFTNNNNKSNLATLDNGHLILTGDFTRNKYRLANALKRIGFTINKFNDENSTFIVKQASDDSINISNKKGLSKIFGKKQKTITEDKPTILVKIVANEKNDNVIVTILNPDGTNFQESGFIIQQLYQELR